MEIEPGLTNNPGSILTPDVNWFPIPPLMFFVKDELLEIFIRGPNDLHGDECQSEMQARLAAAFSPSDNELYSLLDENRGTEAEQYPFPRFELAKCVNQSSSLMA